MTQSLWENFVNNRKSALDLHQVGNGPYYLKPGFPKTFSSKNPLIDIQRETVVRAFDLDAPHLEEKFEQAVCGSGNEWSEITQLNSSSLLAFLCFHKVDAGFKITIPNIGTFDHVYFEVKSTLEIPHSKSNMDVVLTNNETVLFLESKFTEYLTPRSEDFSVSYEEYYKNILGDELKLDADENIRIEVVNGKCKWSGGNSAYYFDGLKQMISHALGICNTLKNKSAQKKYWEMPEGNLFTDDRKFILAEILFRFEKNENGPFDSYNKLYAKLCEKLNAYIDRIGLGNSFSMYPKLLTYQEKVFSPVENRSVLQDKVFNFYFQKNEA